VCVHQWLLDNFNGAAVDSVFISSYTTESINYCHPTDTD